MDKKFVKVSGYGAITVGSIWLIMFIIGLTIVLVSAKQLNEDKITQEKWKELQIPGWLFLGLSILSGTFFAIAFFILFLFWLVGRISMTF